MTHGAASARAAHALASGAAGDAASDLSGGDAFAALLSQVAPDAVPGNKSVHIHGKGKQSSSQESEGDPSDALDTPGEKKATSNNKTAVAARSDRQVIALSDRKAVTDKSIVAADPSQLVSQDAVKTDDTHKTGKPDKKDDHKSAHHKMAAPDTANILALPVTPATTPVTANVPLGSLPAAGLAIAADADAEQADGAVTPPVSGLQTATTGRTGKTAKTDKVQASQTASANSQPIADAPADTKDSAALLAQAVNRIVADAAGTSTPQNQAPVAHGAAKTDLAHTAHNTADTAAASDSATAPVTTPSAQAAAAIPQPAAPRTVQAPAIPQVAGITAASAPQAPAATQPATLSLHTAAPSTDSLPNLNSFALDIAAKSHDGLKQFDIRMDPPELGRVDVHLSIDDSGKVQAHLSADQPQTLALLQKDSSVLRGALRDAGLNMAQNGLNFSLKGQNPQQQNTGNGATSRGRSLSLRATAAIDAAQSVIPAFSSVGADTRLDIHV